jgi:hypothetical protein
MSTNNSDHSFLNNGNTNCFNWRLPIFGAIGFGIAFRITCFFSYTIYDITNNSIAEVIPGVASGIKYGLIRGLIIGVIGGIALSLAYKKNIMETIFTITGIIGFTTSSITILIIDSKIISQIGRVIIELIPIPKLFPVYTMQIIYGIGTGLIFGVISGFILGLGLINNKLLSAIILSIVGGITFSFNFIIAHIIYSYGLCNLWDLWGGIISGAIFGLALAILQLSNERRKSPNPRLEPTWPSARGQGA